MKTVARAAEIAERLNKVRLARTLALLSPLQRQLFRLIPLFFHHHVQAMPGYNGPLTPRGVLGYLASADELQACDTFALPRPDPDDTAAWVFKGIYAMGSTGSFGQNANSDVDIWLVHRAELGAEALAALRQKAAGISLWFAGFDFEVNFYLVHPQQFSGRHAPGHTGQAMGHEHSGSTQHWLLLEEFYRSQIRLAGLTVAWWPQAEADETLLHLGDVHTLPATEYFGASLWQLYKGLDTPHKALLKVLLLEAYASDYPRSRLLCDSLWQRTLAGDFSSANDAYFLLYDSIEAYLLKQRSRRRLEIVRRCFYLKCAIRLSDPQAARDWRYHRLQHLVADWQWPMSLLQTLDDSANWHSGQLQWFNEQLNELLLSSYKTLLGFVSTHRLSEGLRIEELGMLSRKLHTYFSQEKQRVPILNPLWSRTVAEPHLTVIYSRQEQLYHLYLGQPIRRDFIGRAGIYRANTPAALLSWACLNGVATARTRWHELGPSRVDPRALTLASRRLRRHIGAPWRVSKLDLCRPWHYRKLIFMLNLDQDPTLNWRGQELAVALTNADVFSLGRRGQNMLGSIDVIGLNSWGEWQCHRFDGRQALLAALSWVTPGLLRTPPSSEISVMGCSRRLRRRLERRVDKLLRQSFVPGPNAQSSPPRMRELTLAGTKYGLFFTPQGMHYRVSSPESEAASEPWLAPGSAAEAQVAMPEIAMPEVIRDFAAKGAVQYFLRQGESGLEVFILDEDNALTHEVQADGDSAELVASVSHAYAFAASSPARHSFNLPQFFSLQWLAGRLQVLPFGLVAAEQDIAF
ncbi:class I adenylate cyclase [Shewanella sp. AS16]|uniref:class I adenylate cyclase n=1 Tax=Shewanella sp. AS16 TaxID=2907625 RepID=UPI001F291FA8|nr:class I adenylate cyclase [Shewanella sp. AS16]MCE9685971.1 class I adenylate cyclase [Shewanella sp. AS16]